MLPVTLTIAGSDSGGGAGIQADLKTFHALGCFGTTAITAITCQNTTGVSNVQAIDPDIVADQIRNVLTDFPVRAIKTGMLFSTEIITAIEEELTRSKDAQTPVIVDPVMVASTGARLLESSAEAALMQFMKKAFMITPNLPEAEVILEREIVHKKGMEQAARDLYDLTGAIVVLKGGHRLSDASVHDQAIDIYFDKNGIEMLSSPRMSEKNTHGTGCTLSAGIAASIACDMSPFEAVANSRKFLEGALRNAPGLGSGIGPMNHMWQNTRESLPSIS